MKKLSQEEYTARFWVRVAKSAGCWEWQGYRTEKGYGMFYMGGKDKVFSRAHRVSWTLLRGDIPKGLVIDHKCRNRACVNPEHLRVVTVRENALENSNAPSALHSRQTMCLRGHPFDEANTYRHNGQRRSCRKCTAMNQRIRMTKKRHAKQ